MKFRTTAIATATLALWVSQPGNAQSTGATLVYDQTLNMTADQILATVQRQLEEAERQTEKIQLQIERMGDPSLIQPPAIEMAKNDILNSVAALKTKDEQRATMQGMTGAEVFDDDAFGLMEPIGSKVTLEDGTEVDRDPEKYKLEAGLRAHLNEYYAIRDEAITSVKNLESELANVLGELETASDFATVQKLGAAVTVLQGQIDGWNQKVAIAHADVVMAEKEFLSTARVVAQGKREESTLQTQANREAAKAGGGSGAASSTFGFPGVGGTPKKLPWGRKDSAASTTE